MTESIYRVIAYHDAMVDHVTADERGRVAQNREPTASEGVETIESYEVEEGVVLYDAENPLAWVESNAAVTLRERA